MDQLTGMGQAGDWEHGEQLHRKGCGAVEDSKLNMNQRCSLAGDSSFLLGGWGGDGAGLYTVLHTGRMRDKLALTRGTFTQDISRNLFSLSDQSHPGGGAGCPERLCSLCLWSFQDPNGKSTEQPGLVSQMTLLGTGGWTETSSWFPPV